MKTKVAAIAFMGLGALVAPASAQIIATSIPRADSGTGKAAGQKKFAFHLLVAPLAKWKINQLNRAEGAIVAAHAQPNSFLIAGEAAFALGSAFSFGLGGWYNHVGSVNYDFAAAVPDFAVKGTLGTENLFFSEGHASLFYKDIGVQAGIVHVSEDLRRVTISCVSFDSGGACIPLNPPDVTEFPPGADTRNDVDAFLVFKTGSSRWSPKTKIPWTFSLGAGVYRYDSSFVNSDMSLRSSEDRNVFTAFATASVNVYKGLGIDASFWYIGKTKSGSEVKGEADNLSRFTAGVGYTFSR